MKITMLGTGNAQVTECYNTCFVLSEENQYFLVDGGGGNTILRQIKYAGINWKDIKHIFVTHKHIDHLMGIVWMVRLICQAMNKNDYEGEVCIYAHEEVAAILRDLAHMLLQKKGNRFIGTRLNLVSVTDGESLKILGRKVTFLTFIPPRQSSMGLPCISLRRRSSHAVGTSRTAIMRRYMQREVSGCCTRPSACTHRRKYISPMRNITPQ